MPDRLSQTLKNIFHFPLQEVIIPGAVYTGRVSMVPKSHLRSHWLMCVLPFIAQYSLKDTKTACS